MNQDHGGGRGRRRMPLLALVGMLALAVIGGCGGAPSAASPTATPIATLTPTATATATPTPRPTAAPTPRPTATPTPTRPPSPPAACLPPPGVRPVSPVVIRYGNTSKMQVSLTFDSDGGSAGNAAAYLDILHQHGLHATFFLTGNFARAQPDLVRRMLAEGHELGNHTIDHPDLVKPPRIDAFICTELTQAERMIVAAGGHSTRPFFRPPNGSYNDQVRYRAAGLGFRTVLWSVDPRDWDPATTAQDIVNRVLNAPGLKPGGIILMHVNSLNERYALDRVITGLEQRGYAIVPLSQLMQ